MKGSDSAANRPDRSRSFDCPLNAPTRFAFILLATVSMSSAAEPSPRVSPTASSSPAGIVNPNTPPSAPQPQQSSPVFDVKKLAAMTRPAVALVTVLDQAGKPLKLGTGFFVS